MRPYWAVIVDSFREALSSRVLWILLLLISFLLVGFSPMGWQLHPTTRMTHQDIQDAEQLIQVLSDAKNDDAARPLRHIRERLPEELLSEIDEHASADESDGNRRRRLQGELLDEFNTMIRDRDFFEPSVWNDTRLPREATDLLDQETSKLDDEQSQRLNRLALEAACPRHLRSRAGTSVQFHYAVWDVFPPLPMRADQADQMFRGVLAGLTNFLLGFIGIFVAVLVTAPTIPNMFDAGSISLLLSKPISRSLLFLAKFIGGCSFVAISASYLITGCYLLAGFRFGVWSRELLLCIPIFLFLFTIYYVVSALAGLIWRNTVVVIAITLMFWFFCFCTGTAKESVEFLLIQPERLIDMWRIKDGWLASTETGGLRAWREKRQTWDEVSNSSEPAFGQLMQKTTMLGPIYDASNDRLVSVKPAWPKSTLYLSYRESNWTREEIGPAPAGVAALFQHDNKTFVLNPDGVHQMADEPKAAGEGLKVLGFQLPLGTGSGPFRPLGPEGDVPVRGNTVVAVDSDDGTVLLWNEGTVTQLGAGDEGQYSVVREKTLVDEDQRVLVSIAGEQLLVADSGGAIRIWDMDTWQQRGTFRPEGNNQPRFSAAAPGGRWLAVLYHTGRLWIYDSRQHMPLKLGRTGKRRIHGLRFLDANTLALSHDTNRVSVYRLPQMESQQRLVPRPSMMERAYRYGIVPVYAILPKPGKLEETTNYLLTRRKTFSVGPDKDNLSSRQVELDPWRPVWTSALFVVCMLAVSCFYIERQDL